MSRKESYADLKSRAERDNRELCVRQRLTMLQYRGHAADAVETCKDDQGDPCRLELWDAFNAGAGYLVRVWGKKSAAWVDVSYFDDARPSEHDPLQYRLAYERLDIARHNLWGIKAERTGYPIVAVD